jgi:hypothetical protein
MPSGSTDEHLDPSAGESETDARYGPAGFAAAMANILVLEFLAWVTLPLVYIGLAILVPVLIVDALVAFGLTKMRGFTAQIGRGLLIGCAAVTLTVLIVGAVALVVVAVT